MPLAEELRPFTSNTYATLHALDELREKYEMRLGQFVPVSQQEVADIAGLSQAAVARVTYILVDQGWISFEPKRGYKVLKPVPVFERVQ